MSQENSRAKVSAYFALKKPCANCPFRRDGAISLNDGRLDSIVQSLLQNDQSTFQCHKTVHHPNTGGEWIDEDGEHRYKPSGRESMCAGAIIYLEKAGRPTVPMRLGRLMGSYQPEKFMEHADLVIDCEDTDKENAS